MHRAGDLVVLDEANSDNDFIPFSETFPLLSLSLWLKQKTEKTFSLCRIRGALQKLVGVLGVSSLTRLNPVQKKLRLNGGWRETNG